MTPRVVIMALIHGKDGGTWHAVDSVTGGPRCGVALRRPHRAITTTDGPWCRTCWPETALKAVS